MRVLYGVKVAEHNDPNVALVEKALEGVQALDPGRFIVQYMPFLQYAPTWFPVIGPQLIELANYRAAAHTAKDAMLLKVRDAMVRRCTGIVSLQHAHVCVLGSRRRT